MSSAEHSWISVGTAATISASEGPSPAARHTESDASRWLLTREALVNVLLVSVMISVVWGSIAVHLTQQRREVETQAKRETGNLVQAAAESIGQNIASVDDTLRIMRAIYLADPQHFDLSAWTNRVNETRTVALEFALIGRDGNLMASSLGPVVTPSNFSDQDFFSAQTGEAIDRLFISRPIPARAPGRWSVLFTRRIAAADGWFTGVIAASVDPSWLMRLHRSLDIGRGAVMLVGTDGRIRALAGGGDSAAMPSIGDRIDLAGVLDTPVHPDHGTLAWTGSVNGTPQIASFQRIADDDAYVVVSMDWRDILTPYRLYARQYTIFGVCITLLILIAGTLLLSNTRRLLISRQVLRDAMNAISQGVVMIDASGRVPVINRRAGELLHIPDGAACDALDIVRLGDGGADGSDARDHVQPDGTILEIRTHALPTGGMVRTYTDITERKAAEAQIIHLALHDSLTGLPNRRMLADRLGAAIARADGGGAVLLVDLDRFKNINDRHGHSFGDRLLVQATRRLRGMVGEADLVARIGGDEFCILQTSDGEAIAVEALAREIVRALAEPYLIDGQEVMLGASVGIARYPQDGSSVDDILTRADTALFRAKEGGRTTFRFYEAAMDVRIAEQRLLEQDLRDALARGQLSVFYQPIFDCESCRITGFEALLRWFHPTRGAIPADEFIPIAEACGVIVRLGEWVLETACTEATTWDRPLSVAVNLSPKQFWRADLPDRVAAILDKTGLPAARLTLEVTEGVLIDNPLHTLSVMSSLKRQGIRLVLDDFGTGYSSLSYLRRFPFDGLKIDRSFIRTLCEDEESQAIVRAILTLGDSLRLTVVAEGVETSAQLAWLRDESCGAVQGYLLGRPMPSPEIGDFLAESCGDTADALASRPAS